MPKLTIAPELIQQHGEQLCGLRVEPRRAAELAAEIERLNNAVLDAAGALDFNDEPARFEAQLAAHRETGRRRK